MEKQCRTMFQTYLRGQSAQCFSGMTSEECLGACLQQGHSLATSRFGRGCRRSGLPSGDTIWLLIPEVPVSPEAPLLSSVTASSLWLKVSLGREPVTCSKVGQVLPGSEQVLLTFQCEKTHVSHKACHDTSLGRRPALGGHHESRSAAHLSSCVCALGDLKEWINGSLSGWDWTIWLASGEESFSPRPSLVSPPRSSSCYDLTTHPSKGSACPSPAQPRHTSRPASTSLADMGLQNLGGFSWISVTWLLWEPSLPVVRKPRTWVERSRVFLAHDHSWVPTQLAPTCWPCGASSWR